MQAIKIIVIKEKCKIYFGENTPSTPPPSRFFRNPTQTRELKAVMIFR